MAGADGVGAGASANIGGTAAASPASAQKVGKVGGHSFSTLITGALSKIVGAIKWLVEKVFGRGGEGSQDTPANVGSSDRETWRADKLWGSNRLFGKEKIDSMAAAAKQGFDKLARGWV